MIPTEIIIIAGLTLILSPLVLLAWALFTAAKRADEHIATIYRRKS